MQIILTILAFGGLIASLIFLVTHYLALKKLEKEHAEFVRDATEKNKALVEDNEQLQKYAEIRDVDQERERRERLLQEEIQKHSERIKEEVDRFSRNAENEKRKYLELVERNKRAVESAEAQADGIIKRSVDEAASVKNEAKEAKDRMLQMANEKSKQLLDAAEKRAEEIGGEAYSSLKNLQNLKKAEKAIRNRVKGYGDEYLIPAQSLLDELGEQYSHKEAGKELTLARDQVRHLVKVGGAASCDYSESNRKETAILFVLDAFNGKAEEIISRVKDDNYGKLRQELFDAYSLVNHHGKAFRNAAITSQYLDAMVDQLKWAVAVIQLKKEEREEQRRIKQEMREEEKARKEYEKAKKEAEKEEKMLSKLMEEARQRLQEASEAEKAEYETKIAELEQKYKEAEEKNQRAMSMAQQTKSGHVYVISNVGSFGENIYKIGLTRRLEPMDRVKELGDASVPFDFDVHAMIYNENAPLLETSLHKAFHDFQVNKVNPRKEFFDVSLADIRNLIESIGITDVMWTMKAEAAEYRESRKVAETMEQTTQEDSISDEVKELLAESDSVAPEHYKLTFSKSEPGVVLDSENIHKALAGTEETESAGPCPYCDGMIDLHSLKEGQNQCPHCEGVFDAG